MDKLRPIGLALLLVVALSGFQTTSAGPEMGICSTFFENVDNREKGSYEKCATIPFANNNKLVNMPIIGGAYCYNDGSGRCKAFAGRFEFYFNTLSNEILGPVESGDYVNSYGYHERIPISYTPSGKVLYADRSINWAKQEYTSGKAEFSLLVPDGFNWCGPATTNSWPYRSSINDTKSGGRYMIYFFNRQSCIHDKNTNKHRHYNTRFLHNSTIRIDLDYNPVIFAMQDEIANDVRLIKHHRQHWFEVPFFVQEVGDGDLFVKMEKTERKPCKLNSSAPFFFTPGHYRNFSEFCIEDGFQSRSDNDSPLMAAHCGRDRVEAADVPWPYYARGGGGGGKGKISDIIEVELHQLDRESRTQRFLGINVHADGDWRTFAKDGHAFSAVTTIPVPNEGSGAGRAGNSSSGNSSSAGAGDDPKNYSARTVRVVMLYAKYQEEPHNPNDEHYPLPYVADYTATFDGSSWTQNRKEVEKPEPDLNYVDDIAYLHKCKTILVVYGPLYSEYPAANKFDVRSRQPVRSIVELGAWEMVNAFFAVPDEDTLYMYHRQNFLAKYKYTCGNIGAGGEAGGARTLTTATRVGRYAYRFGPSSPLGAVNLNPWVDNSEEWFYKKAGVYKGPIDSPEPPDPSRYPYEESTGEGPVSGSDSTWLYIFVGIGLLLMLAMCIICTLTFRRRRKNRRRLAHSSASGGAVGSSGNLTRRSALSGSLRSRSGSSKYPSVRSGLRSSSAMSGASGKHQSNSSRTTRATARSALGAQASRQRSGSSHSGGSTVASTQRSSASNSPVGKLASAAAASKTKRSSNISHSGASGTRRSSAVSLAGPSGTRRSSAVSLAGPSGTRRSSSISNPTGPSGTQRSSSLSPSKPLSTITTKRSALSSTKK